MNQQEQYEFIKATARPARRLLVKEVLGGFAITGSVAYHDRQNNGVLMEVTHEGVASDPAIAQGMVVNFLTHSQFEAPELPLFMGGEPLRTAYAEEVQVALAQPNVAVSETDGGTVI